MIFVIKKDEQPVASFFLYRIKLSGIMSSTLLTFMDEYYEYDGDLDPEEKGLTIGGYESAWLADLVGAFVLEKTKKSFKNTRYHGLYRDDGFAVFKSNLSFEEICNWREDFQNNVNKITGGDYLQFTCDVWKQEELEPKTSSNKKVTLNNEDSFPYLDMELFWSETNDLQFRVHLKPNQQLKYLNIGSAHTASCFRAIPEGVCQRLAKLTTPTNKNKHLPLDSTYPKHFEALRHAGLINDEPPTLENELEKIESNKLITKTDRKKKQKVRERSRSIFFCVGSSNAWKTPIHKIIAKAKARFGLTWIRVSMSYHKFTNLKEISKVTYQGN